MNVWNSTRPLLNRLYNRTRSEVLAEVSLLVLYWLVFLTGGPRYVTLHFDWTFNMSLLRSSLPCSIVSVAWNLKQLKWSSQVPNIAPVDSAWIPVNDTQIWLFSTFLEFGIHDFKSRKFRRPTSRTCTSNTGWKTNNCAMRMIVYAVRHAAAERNSVTLGRAVLEHLVVSLWGEHKQHKLL